jgi:ribonucleoside-diphosphate reductase alpha chain
VLGLEYANRIDLAHVVPDDAQGGPKTAGAATDHPVGYEHHRGNGTGTKSKNGTLPGKEAAPAPAPKTENAAKAPANSPATASQAAGAITPLTVRGQGEGGGQQAMLGKFSGDAPFCDNCGHITVRNGTCFKCLNCGNSMGCS